MDNTDAKKAAKYREKDTYDTDCKHRFFQNINKFCKEGLVKEINVEKIEDSIEIHHYKFLIIPDLGQGIRESDEMPHSEDDEKRMEMSYLNSPIVNTLMIPFTAPNCPIGKDKLMSENVVLLHIPEAQNGSCGNTSPTSEIASDGMEMSYLSLPLMTQNLGDVFSNKESYPAQLYISSEENREGNVSPTSELQDKWMKMSYFNPQIAFDDSVVDPSLSTKIVHALPSLCSQDYLQENFLPITEIHHTGMEISNSCLQNFVPSMEQLDLHEDYNIDLGFWENELFSGTDKKNEKDSPQQLDILTDISNTCFDPKTMRNDATLLPSILESSNLFDWSNKKSVFLKEDSANKALNHTVPNENNPLMEMLDVWEN